MSLLICDSFHLVELVFVCLNFIVEYENNLGNLGFTLIYHIFYTFKIHGTSFNAAKNDIYFLIIMNIYKFNYFYELFIC